MVVRTTPKAKGLAAVLCLQCELSSEGRHPSIIVRPFAAIADAQVCWTYARRLLKNT